MLQYQSIAGHPHGQTVVKKSTDDTAQTLDDLGVTLLQKGATTGAPTARPRFAYVSIETNEIRHGPSTPSQSVGHIGYIGQIVTLEGWAEIQEWKFTNNTSGSNADLQISIEY